MKPYNLLLLITLLLSTGNISAQNDNCCSKKVFLGVNYESISRDKADKLGIDNTYGLYVTNVIEGTSADKYGILPLDYIYGIDDYRVGRDQSLGSILRKYRPGDKVSLLLYRKGRKKELDYVLGSTSDKYKYKSKKKSKAFFGISPMGGGSRRDIGIRVSISRNSTAEDMGLEDGDVITQINGYKIYSWTEVSGTINMLEPGDKIAVEYYRDGRRMSGNLPIKSYKETKGNSSCDDDNSSSYSFNWNDDGDFDINIDRNSYFGDDNNDHNIFADGEQLDMSRVEVAIQDNPGGAPSSIRTRGSASANVHNISLHAQSNGRFKLQFSATRSDNIQVRIYNSAGRQLYLYDMSDFDGLFEDEVNLSQNGSGSYYLYVQQGNEYALKKLELN